MYDLFPLGLRPYVIGGAMIGAAIAVVYVFTGRIAGISGIFTAAHSWWSRRACFGHPAQLDERVWKGLLVLGLLVGAAAYTAGTGAVFVTEVHWSRLLVAGLFVGFGTRTARGCTSGHGICGVSAFAAPSLASTAIFMGVAILTAWLVGLAGVTP